MEEKKRAPNIYISLQSARDAVEDLDKEQIADIFLGLLDYFEGKEVDFSDDIVLRKSIKPLLRDIDHNNEKYAQKVERQRVNANRRWHAEKEEEGDPDEDTKESQQIQGDAMASDGMPTDTTDANNKYNINYNNKCNNKYKDNNKSLFEEDEVSESKISLEEIKNTFNALVDENKSTLSKINVLQNGSKRAKSTIARIKEFGLKQFIKGLENAAKSKFLNDATWASYDWIIAPNNFPKVLEGNYNKENHGNSNQYQQAKSNTTELQSRLSVNAEKDYSW